MIAITVACRPPARTAPAPRSSPTLAVAAAEPAPGLRLGEAVIPERYDAELVVDPRADRFRGAIAIDIALARPTATVWLHARDLAIHEAYVESSSGKRAARANVSGDRLGLELGETLGAGRATLHLVYDGPIAQDESAGLFAERVGDDSYAYTQLEPTDARRVFPCFDEPGFKARWKLRLRLPKGLAALGNAPVATTVDAGEERVVTFEETAPLASYLVAFAVGPFDLVDAGVA